MVINKMWKFRNMKHKRDAYTLLELVEIQSKGYRSEGETSQFTWEQERTTKLI